MTRNPWRGMLTVMATILALTGGAGAFAQCNAYSMQVNPSGAVFEPGVTDIGNHGDDVVTYPVPLPFGVSVYFGGGSVCAISSNGNLQFGTVENAFFNTNLPTSDFSAGSAFPPVVCPLWDDLRTDATPTAGVFTSVSGVAPQRRFNVEWRATYFNYPDPAHFSISFYEGRTHFDFFYPDSSPFFNQNGQEATIGCQGENLLADPAATVFSFNPPAPGSLTGVSCIRFHCLPYGPSNPRCIPSASPTTLLNDGTGATMLSVGVVSATEPRSTAHVVLADLTAIGGASIVPLTQTSLNTFTGTFTVANGTPVGPAIIPITVVEVAAPSRTGTCSVTLDIVPPPSGACCVMGACSIQSQTSCAAAGGVYSGDNTPCTTCWCATTAPVNDLCSGAIALPIPGTIAGSTCAATVDSAVTGPTCGIPIDAPGVWYRLTGTGNTITLTTCSPSTSFATRLNVFCDNVCVGASLCAAGGGAAGAACAVNPQHSTVSFCSQFGAAYRVLVHGSGGQSGNFMLTATDGGSPCSGAVPCVPTGACCVVGSCSLRTQAACVALGGVYRGDASICNLCSCVLTAPTNDACAGAIALPVPGSLTGSTCAATLDSPLTGPSCGVPISQPGVWYRLIGTGRFITLSTCNAATTFPTRLSVFCDNGCASGPACIAGAGGTGATLCGIDAQHTVLTFCAQAGLPYLVLVHASSPLAGNFTLSAVNGGPCSGGPSCAVQGACCQGTSCAITSPAACATLGGRYLGNDSTCTSPGPITYARRYSRTPNLPIPDAPDPALMDTLTIPDAFAFSNVSVRVRIPDHPSLNELIIRLETRATSVDLWRGDCSGSAGLDVTFSDAGDFVRCDSPTIGEFLPSSALNFSSSSSNGPWTLVVEDMSGGNVGTLAEWELLFDRAVTPISNCSCHGACVADFDDGSATGTPDGGVTIDDLLYYLLLFENGDACSDVDDGSFTGTPDGGVTIDDLLYFLFRFESGC